MTTFRYKYTRITRIIITRILLDEIYSSLEISIRLNVNHICQMVLISQRQTVDLNLYRLSPQYYKRKSNVEIKAFVNYGKSKSQLFCDKSNRSYRAGLKCSFIPDEQNLHSMGEEKSLLKVRKTQWQALGFTNALKRRYQFLSLFLNSIFPL